MANNLAIATSIEDQQLTLNLGQKLREQRKHSRSIWQKKHWWRRRDLIHWSQKQSGLLKNVKGKEGEEHNERLWGWRRPHASR